MLRTELINLAQMGLRLSKKHAPFLERLKTVNASYLLLATLRRPRKTSGIMV